MAAIIKIDSAEFISSARTCAGLLVCVCVHVCGLQ